MSLSIRRRGKAGLWYVRGTVTVHIDGAAERVRVGETALGTHCQREAEAERDKIAAQIRRRYLLPAAERGREKTFGQLIEAYLDGGGEARFLTPIEAALARHPAGEITQDLLDREGRRAYPDAAPSTLRRQWHGPVISILNGARISHTLKKPPEGAWRTVWQSPPQAEAVIRAALAAPPRNRSPYMPALIEFFYGTGAREAEALLLQWDDLYLDYETAILRDTKNGEERSVHLPRRLVASLARLPSRGKGGAVFRTRLGRPFTVRRNSGAALAGIKSAVTAAGFDPHRVTEHTFRHSWATWHHAQNRDMLRLQQRGGWKSLRMVERYAKIPPPGLAADLAKFGWTLEPAEDAAGDSVGHSAGTPPSAAADI